MTVTEGESPTHESAETQDRVHGLQKDLLRDLDGEVQFDEYTRHLFARDASMYAITPMGVAFPRHADDVAAAVAAAAAHG
ncbi:MAG: hypothetical protein WCD21_14755, partial [Streptomyces sp.]